LKYSSVGYGATIQSGQNTHIQISNGNFGSLVKGETKTIYSSVVLNNTGDLDATVDARFTTKNGEVYGLVSGANVLSASSFSLQEAGTGAWKPLDNSGTDVSITTTPFGVTHLDARLSVQSDQPGGDYAGTVIFTFGNAV